MDQRPISRNEILEKTLREAHFKFAINCLHKVIQIKSKKNFAFSPFCIYKGLLMIYSMVHGNTEEQLNVVLHLSNHVNFKHDLLRYTFNSPRRLPPQNMVFPGYNDYIKLWLKWNEYLRSVRFRNLNGELRIRDYTDFPLHDSPLDTIMNINELIKNELEGYMIHPVQLSAVRMDMECILMSVVYFDQEFQISIAWESDSLSVSPIPDKRRRRRYFCQQLKMHVSEFPYENDNISLFILLPASIMDSGYWRIKEDATDTDISNMIKRLSTENGMLKLRELLDDNKPSKEDTSSSKLPIFRVEINLKIRELLRALSLEELISFDAIHEIEVADKDYVHFLHLGNAVHRTYVNVTEESTAAGAATMIYTGQESSPSIKIVDVNCNYPFVWLIYDKLRRHILFAGAFNKFASS